LFSGRPLPTESAAVGIKYRSRHRYAIAQQARQGQRRLAARRLGVGGRLDCRRQPVPVVHQYDRLTRRVRDNRTFSMAFKTLADSGL